MNSSLHCTIIAVIGEDLNDYIQQLWSVLHQTIFCSVVLAADPGFERDSYTLSEIVGYRVFSISH